MENVDDSELERSWGEERNILRIIITPVLFYWEFIEFVWLIELGAELKFSKFVQIFTIGVATLRVIFTEIADFASAERISASLCTSSLSLAKVACSLYFQQLFVSLHRTDYGESIRWNARAVERKWPEPPLGKWAISLVTATFKCLWRISAK